MKNYFENVKTVSALKTAVQAASVDLVDLAGAEKEAKAAMVIASAATAVKAVNEAILADFVAGIMAINAKSGVKAARNAYLSAYKCNRVSVFLDKKTGDLAVNEKEKIVNWFKVERAYQINQSTETDENGKPVPKKSATFADEKAYAVTLACFIDNITRLTATAVNVKFTSPLAIKTKKDLGMDSNSKTALEKQLNMVCKAIAGDDAPKMIAADVKYISIAVSKAADCKVTMAKESTYMNAIVEAMDTRRNNRAYSFQSKAACHKEDKKSK